MLEPTILTRLALYNLSRDESAIEILRTASEFYGEQPGALLSRMFGQFSTDLLDVRRQQPKCARCHHD